ncbi:MAG TPA: PDZ domain-containing protein [Chthoniobacteraceae bacterium]|nr:PDZ domain-containing protein [Chthoniobacteraceae bacterium]
MNHTFLVLFAILAVVVRSPAQERDLLVPPPKTITIAPSAHVDADGTLHLSPGSLANVVSQIESIVPELNKAGNSDEVMPNIVFDDLTKPGEAAVPANLRLRKVSPVQAVALAAAAAGCKLETVQGPDGDTIGYRIVVAPKAATNDDTVGIGTAITTYNGEILINDILPDSPADRSQKLVPGDRIVSVAERGSDPVPFNGLSMPKAAELLRGPAGSVAELKIKGHRSGKTVTFDLPLVREQLKTSSWKTSVPMNVFIPATQGIATVGTAEAQFNKARNELEKQPRPDTLTVRVYAVGPIFGGTEAESVEKEDSFKRLVAEALDRAETGKAQPVLSFHNKSRALIVKATAAEHEIIQQIIDVLKENESGAGIGKPRR